MVDKADFVSWRATGFGFIGIASSDTTTKELALQEISKMIA
jgi:hypothetical protein